MILKLWKNHFIDTAKYYLITIAICLIYPLCMNIITALLDLSLFHFFNSLTSLVIIIACFFAMLNSLKISMDQVFGKNTFFARQIDCSNRALVFTNYLALSLDFFFIFLIGQIAAYYDIVLGHILISKESLSESFKTVFVSPWTFFTGQFGFYGEKPLLIFFICFFVTACLMFIAAVRHSKFFHHRGSFLSYSIITFVNYVVWTTVFFLGLIFLPGFLTYSISNGKIIYAKMTWASIYSCAHTPIEAELTRMVPIVGLIVPTLLFYIAEMIGIYYFACKKFNVSA